MPMDKISTPISITITKSKNGSQTPNPETLAKLRQFARAYTHVHRLGKIGGLVLN